MGLVATFAAWTIFAQTTQTNAAFRFSVRVQDVTSAIRERLFNYEQVLRGALGFMVSSDSVSRTEWKDYVATLAVDKVTPGTQGIGFAKRIHPSDLERHIESVRSEGFPHYRVWPDGHRAEYTAIIYLEPFSDRNLRAFGYDMFSEPVRQEAMARARDTGVPSISGEVTLVQETGQDVQAGFLMYLPFYGKRIDLADVGARRRALIGYVYAPFRASDFMRGLLDSESADVRIEISDAGDILYPGVNARRQRSDHTPLFTETRTLNLYGRQWQVKVESLPLFESTIDWQKSRLVLAGGLVTTLLLASIARSLAINRRRALDLESANRQLSTEAERHRRTSQALEEARQETQRILESISDGVVATDGDWRFVYANSNAGQLLEKNAPTLIGSRMWDVFPLAEDSRFEEKCNIVRQTGNPAHLVEYFPPLRKWFDLSVFPYDDGVSVYFRDVTIRKHAEEGLLLRDRVIEASVNAILITDPTLPDNPIIYVNPAFERMTGYSADEAIGRNCRFLQRGDRDQPELEKVRNIIREERNGRAVVRNYRQDGSLFWNELHIAPVRNTVGRLTHFVGVQNDITETIRYQEELEHQATHDALTGLGNRSLLRDRMHQAVAAAERHRNRVAVAFFDLDNFKIINDSLGHDAGDTVLRTIAQRFLHGVRDGDSVARLGGDEFVVVLTDQERVEEISEVVKRLCHAVSEPLPLHDQELVITSSVGISVYPDDGGGPDVLLRNADAAMYAAKDHGRNTMRFYTSGMNDTITRRLELATNLRHAVDRKEFELHYQPRIDFATGKPNAYEALIRWRHPDLGMVAPGNFISLAEETGQIVAIGEWVLRAACTQNRLLREEGIAPTLLSVNLSARQLRQPDFPELLETILRDTGMPAELLELEITESMVMHDVENVIELLNKLKSLGVHLAIDDFGTGYSSLSYLKRFPIDRLKIDQSFVRDIPGDPNDAAITMAIVGLAHNLNIKVIAEGIETKEQRDFLRASGCDEGQGYFLSKPIPLGQLRAFLR